MRIRDTDTTLGRLHSWFDHPFLTYTLQKPNPMRTFTMARSKFNAIGMQIISIAGNKTVRQDIAHWHGYDPETIEREPMTQEEKLMTSVFHELVHTGQAAIFDPKNEAAADNAAVDLYTKIKKTPDLGKRYLYWRTLNIMEPTHNVTLDLDAHMDGRPAPDTKDIVLATQEVMDATARAVGEYIIASGMNRSNGFLRPYIKGEMTSLNSVNLLNLEGMYRLRENPGNISPLARRLTDLAIEGAEYMMPKLTAEIKTYIATNRPQARPALTQ